MSPLLLLSLIGPVPAPPSLEALPAQPVGRVRVRFDANWRFRRNPPDRRDDGPGLEWTWRKAAGAGEAPPTDDAGWQKAGRGDVFGGRPGFAWFRTTLTNVPKDPRAVLHFGGVDDNADVYLNGKKLLHHEGWDESFDVPLAESLKVDGPNLVLVLVENQGGGGGVWQAAKVIVPTAPTKPSEPSPTYDDRSWRMVHLPHDYVVEGTFDPNADTGHGSLPTPTAWYRKSFTVPNSYRGKDVWVDFDGVYRDATVYLNGKKLANNPCGYIGFRVDLSKDLNYGAANVLAVHVDPRKFEGWWYEGGGIYRHVWLNAAPPVHIVPDGVFAKCELQGKEAEVTVTTELSEPAPPGTRLTTFLDPPGPGKGSGISEPLDGQTRVVQKLRIPNPRLWSPESPKLYRVRSYVTRGKQALVYGDSVETPFGIRTIRFDKDHGFFLNGKHVLLKGTCNHLDHAGVGVGVPDSLQIWRLKQLQKLGCNSVRCSHNPPSREFLDACDRLGILVMDEVRHLGDTEQAKASATTKADDLAELKAAVLRDRNHPSIVLWSLANEEGIAGLPNGAKIMAAMQKVERELDGTRPTTAAMNHSWDRKEGFGPLLDVMGFNYNIGVYDQIHKLYPDKPMIATETASTVSTRGEYVNDPVKGYVSAYDVNYPGWAATAETAWKAVVTRPWMAGSFVWTGFDYKGEPTPYGWPCVNSHFGILDLCGFPKDNAWYYRAWWGDKPVVHLLPHWTHPGDEGKPIDVWVQSNAETVELRLNGRSIGTHPVPKYGHLEWSVIYEPGKLEAIGRTNGKVVAQDVVETAGAAAKLRLTADRTVLNADGEDLVPVNVEVLDDRGHVVPNADNDIHFEVTGPARIAGVGNGDPSSHEPDQASHRKAFHGLCQVLLQAKYVRGGGLLRAYAPGLASTAIAFTIK